MKDSQINTSYDVLDCQHTRHDEQSRQIVNFVRMNKSVYTTVARVKEVQQAAGLASSVFEDVVERKHYQPSEVVCFLCFLCFL